MSAGDLTGTNKSGSNKGKPPVCNHFRAAGNGAEYVSYYLSAIPTVFFDVSGDLIEVSGDICSVHGDLFNVNANFWTVRGDCADLNGDFIDVNADLFNVCVDKDRLLEPNAILNRAGRVPELR